MQNEERPPTREAQAEQREARSGGRGDSDPLPFTQVDRAAKPIAMRLAGRIGTSNQHAIGSLVEFWDINGDPRDLERLLVAGKREVVLPAEVVRRRFRIASGHDVDPAELESMGLLEARGDDYRVRGMSRYFEPVEARMKAREAAIAGGKASAKARKQRLGTAQPRSGDRSEPGSAAVREPFESGSNGFGTPPEAEPKPEDIGQRSKVIFKDDHPKLSGPGFFAWAQEQRLEHGLDLETLPRIEKLNRWYAEAMSELNGDDERLRATYLRFTDDQHWAKATPPWPFGAFAKLWRDHAVRKAD